MQAGIEAIGFYVPGLYLSLSRLAAARRVDPDKYRVGLGQEKMAVAPPDEDVVTMAATASERALAGIDRKTIGAVVVGSEGGVDWSKSVAAYLHRLLGLRSSCEVFETKQACCGATVALRHALARVTLSPSDRVLVVGSDIARYELGTPAEPTQGAGACALVVSAWPRLMGVDHRAGVHTEEVMDFWRPAYRREALVDGKASLQVYLRALEHSAADHQRLTGVAPADCHRLVCHLPFGRMAEKACRRLGAGERLHAAESLVYNRVIGNSYTASLYIALVSLLENSVEDLSGKRLALYSYGSGAMGLFFTARVTAGYRRRLNAADHRRMLASRRELSVAEYETMHRYRLPTDGAVCTCPRVSHGRFRLAGMREHQRQYEEQAAAEAAVGSGLAAAPGDAGAVHPRVGLG